MPHAAKKTKPTIPDDIKAQLIAAFPGAVRKNPNEAKNQLFFIQRKYGIEQRFDSATADLWEAFIQECINSAEPNALDTAFRVLEDEEDFPKHKDRFYAIIKKSLSGKDFGTVSDYVDRIRRKIGDANDGKNFSPLLMEIIDEGIKRDNRSMSPELSWCIKDIGQIDLKEAEKRFKKIIRLAVAKGDYEGYRHAIYSLMLAIPLYASVKSGMPILASSTLDQIAAEMAEEKTAEAYELLFDVGRCRVDNCRKGDTASLAKGRKEMTTAVDGLLALGTEDVLDNVADYLRSMYEKPGSDKGDVQKRVARLMRYATTEQLFLNKGIPWLNKVCLSPKDKAPHVLTLAAAYLSNPDSESLAQAETLVRSLSRRKDVKGACERLTKQIEAKRNSGDLVIVPTPAERLVKKFIANYGGAPDNSQRDPHYSPVFA